MPADNGRQRRGIEGGAELNTTLIACRDASFAYNGRTAVCGLNFQISAGDCLCVAGENGSGKSTLLKGLARLIPPSGGSVEFSGELRASQCGYLPQEIPAQKDFPASAYEVVISGRLASCGIRPFYTRSDRAAALENMRRLKVHQLRRRCFRELSGGERQRVLLARALCAAQKTLLLDEPVSGLDPVATRELYGLVAEVNAEGMTVVMVSHDVGSALRHASHVLHLKTSQVFFGSSKEYLETDEGRAFALQGGEG